MAQERWYFQHGAGLMRSRRMNEIRRRCGYSGVFSYMQILEAAIPGGGIIPLDGSDDVEDQIADAVDPVDKEAVRKVIDLGVKKGWIVIAEKSVTILDDVFSRPSITSTKPRKETEDTEPEEEIEATEDEIAAAEQLFEELWSLYPQKRNKDRVTQADKVRLLRMGKDACVGSMEAYKNYICADSTRKWAHGSTFFTTTIHKFADKKGKKKNPSTVPAPTKVKEQAQEKAQEQVTEKGVREKLYGYGLIGPTAHPEKWAEVKDQFTDEETPIALRVLGKEQ